MIQTETKPVFDLAGLSSRAEILRSASDRLVAKVLTTSAVHSGIDAKLFRNILNDNIHYWRDGLHAPDKRPNGWGVALGTNGRGYSLTLERGELNESTKVWGELLLVGYLSRLGAVTVETANTHGIESQWAHGTIDCVRTSLGLTQYANSVDACGYGPQSFNSGFNQEDM